MKFVEKLYQSLKINSKSNAFYIGDEYYSYHQLLTAVSKIRGAIQKQVSENQKLVGLVTNDDLETYASIIALWFEGKAYVPLNSNSPETRNRQILKITDTDNVIDSSDRSLYVDFNLVNSKKIENTIGDLPIKEVSGNQLAYILFTSGSTGVPKGVPITINNLDSFVNAIEKDPDFNITNRDRCLQMFELTFDMSVVSYLLPLLSGACVFTLPPNSIKYFYVFKLIKEKKLTVLTLVASIIHYLRPYFSEINASDVKYCSFAGGALYKDIASEWSKCIPEGRIFNYYGPTETTIYSGYYPYDRVGNDKSSNGIISIGTPMGDMKYMVADDNNEEVPDGVTGELCIAGGQVMPGYWKNENRNKLCFFTIKENDKEIRFYKSGDLCYKDEEGDYMYVGRADFQVKIRGYRVELAEIEHHAKTITGKVNIVALDIVNKLGNAELALAIEGEDFETSEMVAYLKSKIPDYMVPGHIKIIKEFPHNLNGKIDRKKLKTHFKLN